jgi:hypothetical protein
MSSTFHKPGMRAGSYPFILRQDQTGAARISLVITASVYFLYLRHALSPCEPFALRIERKLEKYIEYRYH